MASDTAVGGHRDGFGATTREDGWWVGPTLTFLGLSTFVVYSTWAAFQGNHYFVGAADAGIGQYLSPFYSPVVWSLESAKGSAPLQHTLLGAWPAWWPAFLPASPAFLILAFPGSFRFTCYYYRKAYYRSFAGSPPGCAVGPLGRGKTKYQGEVGLLIFQNLHRYTMYFALVFLPILAYDAFLAFFNKDGQLGVGVGTIVLCINVCLLSSYTFGCHSFRHLIGGRKDCMSCGKATVQYKAWKLATLFNERHMAFAWISLFWVGFTDLYVRLVSMGVITDLNTWGS